MKIRKFQVATVKTLSWFLTYELGFEPLIIALAFNEIQIISTFTGSFAR